MPIIEPVIRPPSEADSFLLQVTLGCSADRCRFCGAYKTKSFCIKDPKEIFADIDDHARRHPDTRRVFLMDGDALVLSHEKLVPILKKLAERFPKLSRVSAYANGRNIAQKSDAELADLRAYQLSLMYMGLETGSQEILDRMEKSSSVEEMVDAVRRADNAQIKSSVIVLLGLGGREHSKAHVEATIAALNRMQPRYLSFLTLMIVPGTPLAQDVRARRFTPLDPYELTSEAYAIIQGLDLPRTVFRSNHASNYLALEGTLPKDKERLLQELKCALDGTIALRPELLRGL